MLTVLTNSLAIKDLPDVGSLSRRGTFNPVSAPLQRGIRFFRHPKPATAMGGPCDPLSRPKPGAVRGFHVPLREVCGVRCLLSTGGRNGHEAAKSIRPPPPSPISAQACQPLWLVSVYDLYCRFTYVHHTRYLAFTRFVVTRRADFSRRQPRVKTTLQYIVSPALYSGA